MKLSDTILSELPHGIKRPTYDRAALKAGIVHIGLGNFHRAHQAWYLQQLMQQGLALDWAIIGAGVRHADEDQRQHYGGGRKNIGNGGYCFEQAHAFPPQESGE